MAGSSQTTTDHEVIRRWAEERGGHPASVRDTGDKQGPGVLRIDFEEKEPDDRLEPVDWDQFFEKFEQAGLAFLYQDTLKSGKQSRFFKFVQREGTSRDMGGRGKPGSRGTGSADEADGEKKPASRSRKAAETKAEAGSDQEKKATSRRKAEPAAEDARAEREKAKEEERRAKEEEKRKEEERRARDEEKRKREEEKRKDEAKAEAPKKPVSRSRKAAGAKAEDGGGEENKATTRRKTEPKAEGGGNGARSGSSNTTTDPDEIRRWVEERQGHPARVRDTGGKNDAGLLRIDFEEPAPDDRDARLEPIEWDEFFQKFEEAGLAFLHQDTMKSGKQSRFFKFVQREGTSRDMGGRGKRGSRGSGSADESDGGGKKR